MTEALWAEYAALSERDLLGFAGERRCLDVVCELLGHQAGGKEGSLCLGDLCQNEPSVVPVILGSSEWREGILTVVGETFSPCLDRPTHNGIKELDKKTETVYNSRYQTHGSPRV